MAHLNYVSDDVMMKAFSACIINKVKLQAIYSDLENTQSSATTFTLATCDWYICAQGMRESTKEYRTELFQHTLSVQLVFEPAVQKTIKFTKTKMDNIWPSHIHLAIVMDS